MGIAEIQAALAQSAPPANPFAAAAPPAPAFQPGPLPAPQQPSPFGPPHTAAANPFGGSAPAPVFAPPPAPAFTAPTAPATPVQTAFAFNPPHGFNPASAPPINPPGERESLNSAPVEVPAQPPAPEHPAEPKRRGRKPKAEPAAAEPKQNGFDAAIAAIIAEPLITGNVPAERDELASPAEVVLGRISTEDLVAVLRERGYSVWLEAKSS